MALIGTNPVVYSGSLQSNQLGPLDANTIFKTLTEALANFPKEIVPGVPELGGLRYIGQKFMVQEGPNGVPCEYWFKDGIEDENCVLYSAMPEATENDEGKILTVKDGEAQWNELPKLEADLTEHEEDPESHDGFLVAAKEGKRGNNPGQFPYMVYGPEGIVVDPESDESSQGVVVEPREAPMTILEYADRQPGSKVITKARFDAIIRRAQNTDRLNEYWDEFYPGQEKPANLKPGNKQMYDGVYYVK